MVRICLYQPDIAQNTGTILRTAACMNVGVDIIEPCGFIFSERKFKRAGMDYIDSVDLVRHTSWETFYKQVGGRRIVLMTTKSAESVWGFKFQPDDILLFGRESAGAPEEVHQAANARITIPMQNDQRSLNVAVSVGMTLAVALSNHT